MSEELNADLQNLEKSQELEKTRRHELKLRRWDLARYVVKWFFGLVLAAGIGTGAFFGITAIHDYYRATTHASYQLFIRQCTGAGGQIIGLNSAMSCTFTSGLHVAYANEHD